MMRPFILVVPAAALLLSACEGEPAGPVVDGNGTAEGEVLGGTISDDMIPLEQLRSQAPLAPRTPSATGASGAAATAPTNAETGTADAAPAPETP
jgi:hypothetical protein